MPNWAVGTDQRIINHIGYRNTVIVGEVTEVNPNKTFNCKLSGEDDAYINIPTIFTNPDFEVGEMVGLQFNYGDRGDPIIIGRDRRKVQMLKIVYYNYV